MKDLTSIEMAGGMEARVLRVRPAGVARETCEGPIVEPTLPLTIHRRHGMYTVETFGSDCMGNVTGWRVMGPGREVVAQYVGDIYKPAQREQAQREAGQHCDTLNALNTLTRRASNARRAAMKATVRGAQI